MKDLKHTPAPWKITQMGNISGNNDIIVVTTQANLPPDENEANQKLIASAPELLEALILCVETLQGIVGTSPAELKAIEVIKKATE